MQILSKLKVNKQFEILAYKILCDVLFLWLLTFFGLLIAESAVPGYFSVYLSFTKMIIALFVLLALIAFLGKRNELSFKMLDLKRTLKNKTTVLLLLVSLVLTINSVRFFGKFDIAIISLSSIAILFLFYKIFLFSEK
jgi:hypothetical protein